MTEPITHSVQPRRFGSRLCRALLLLTAGVLTLACMTWAMLAVCYADLHGSMPRYGMAVLILLAVIGSFLLVRRIRFKFVTALVPFVIVLGWYLMLHPSNERDWLADVARVPWADLNGSQANLHNVRNFGYRSETDFTPVWEDRVYDLNRLRTVDLILVYWGSDAIAHAIMSFGFDDGQYLAVSIETRKEKGESYSAVQGFFRQYELIYVFADERDVLRLRTNYRKEDVYLYRTRANPQQARAVLMSYLDRAAILRNEPEWYNALTTNCATGVLPHIQAGGVKGEMSWRVLLSGYAAEQAYSNGFLDDSMPFEQLRLRSRINDAALKTTDTAADFSTLIRAGLPTPAVGGS